MRKLKKLIKKLKKLCVKVIFDIAFKHFTFVVLVGDKKLKKDKHYQTEYHLYYWLIKVSIFKKYFSLFLFNRSIIDYNKVNYNKF